MEEEVVVVEEEEEEAYEVSTCEEHEAHCCDNLGRKSENKAQGANPKPVATLRGRMLGLSTKPT